MRNNLAIIVIIMLIFTSISQISGSTINYKTNDEIIKTGMFDQLDQQSSQTDKPYAVGASDRELGQTFTPTYPILTKVILRLKSTGNAEFYKYYIDIKSSYIGSALTSAYIDRDELIVGSGFYEFDFPDINVTTGTEYYIILRGVSDSGDTSRVYWWYGYPDPYAGGDAWYESISGWNYLLEATVYCDFVFQTYGLEENNPPYAPIQPLGPTSGVTGETYFYSTSAIDPDDDDIQYGWDWDGDSIVDEYSSLMGSGSVDSRSHSWPYPGTFYVKVKTKDEHNALSGFSSPLIVTITGDNNPPNKPIRPSGEANGKPDIEYEYASLTSDPEGDDIYYMFDWGDGETSIWLGPYNNSEIVYANHTWISEGTFEVKVQAKDEHDLLSDWSDPLEVSMPKIKSNMPFGIIIVFGFDVDIKIVQLEPGEDYVDLEILSKPLYIWENEIYTRNPGEFIRLYFAKGLFSPSLPFCFGICEDWSIIG